jgi:hypothetical protein
MDSILSMLCDNFTLWLYPVILKVIFLVFMVNMVISVLLVTSFHVWMYKILWRIGGASSSRWAGFLGPCPVCFICGSCDSS